MNPFFPSSPFQIHRKFLLTFLENVSWLSSVFNAIDLVQGAQISCLGKLTDLLAPILPLANLLPHKSRISFFNVKLYCVTPLKLFISFTFSWNKIPLPSNVCKAYMAGWLATSLSHFSLFTTSLTQLHTHCWFKLNSAQGLCLLIFSVWKISSNGYSLLSLCSHSVRLFMINMTN